MIVAEPSPVSPFHGVDPDVMRFLDLHEARAHALGGRVVRDLDDGILLHDPIDPEPFWNRLAAIRWPLDTAAFDRRLGEILAVFGSLGRRPHLWLAPAHTAPDDLGERLVVRGFVDLGGGHLMVLVDRSLARIRSRMSEASVGLERIRGGDRRPRSATIDDITSVLGEAFEVDEARRTDAIEGELVRALRSRALTVYLARIDGQPVAVAKGTTFGRATYLSSIGVRPGWQRRGLGALVTAAAVYDGLAAGSRWTYLGVFSDNVGARRLYETLGFATVGGRSGDYLLG